jgi:N-acetyl-anhydromuramyl-L-alanine amidase AmpD
VCGERVHVGVPVVLWSDPGGYDAYRPGPVLAAQGPAGLRYTPGRASVPNTTAPDRAQLAAAIDLLMVHYDACGFSRRCFHLLHDERVLSTHFLLDVDGTLYQTLDLRDQAWHGRFVNARSIGIELAHVGVWSASDPTDDPHRKRRWYVREGERLRLSIPTDFGDPGIRGSGPFFAARAEPLRGAIHGVEWEQVDFTPQQYETLVKLTAALRRVFPGIALDAPRAPDGRVRNDLMTRAEVDAFHGILGHYHITTERNDPGPAFDWERFLAEVRAEEQRADAATPRE